MFPVILYVYLVVLLTFCDSALDNNKPAITEKVISPSNNRESLHSASRCHRLYNQFQEGWNLNLIEQEYFLKAFCDGSSKSSNKTFEPENSKTTTDVPTRVYRCGETIFNKQQQNTNRITGRSKHALLGAWPWMGGLYHLIAGRPNENMQCAATLISEEWALTAAHCVSETETVKLAYIRLGDLDVESSDDDATPVDVNITESIPHPKFSLKPAMNNIALVRLAAPVQYSDHIHPICLHSGETYLNESYYDKKKPTVIGWGALGPGLVTSSHLLEATLNVVKQSKCKENYAEIINSGDIIMDNSVLCAVGPGGNNACQGDSGGPLMFPDPKTGIWSQGGIVSSGGVDCSDENYPGVYTKVATYIDWINTVTGLKF